MRYLKPLILSCIILLVFILINSWLNREKWQAEKTCATCQALKTRKQQKLIGTLKISPNKQTIFTDQLTGLSYQLISCDATCETKQRLPLEKIGIADYTAKEAVYFNIAGKIIQDKSEFVYSAIYVLNTRKFIKPNEINDLTLNEIKEKYQLINEETFLLKDASISEFRIALYNHFGKNSRQQSIPIKEATWEINDSTLLTMWFIEKQHQWQPLDQYQWKKGTEF